MPRLKRKHILNVINEFSETPLHKAAENGHLTVVKYILSKKAFINVQNSLGNFAKNVQTNKRDKNNDNNKR